MPMIQTDSQHYTDIADAIRDMSGSSEVFYPADMAGGVRSIPQTIAIAPIIYSLEEREVGVWTDGKPLYQKTIITSNSTKNGEVNIDVSSLNIDSCVNIFGSWIRYVTTLNIYLTYMFNSVENPSALYYAWLRYTNSSNNISYKINMSNAEDTTTTQVITLQYTKTTDTPGSGTWTPSGVPAHHYSTTEQVIGTWTDGKPLYEKSYFVASPTVNSEHSIYDDGLALVDYVVNSSAHYKIEVYNSGTLGYAAYCSFDNDRSSSSSYIDMLRFVSTGSARITYLIYASNIMTIKNLCITVQYTKTTD